MKKVPIQKREPIRLTSQEDFKTFSFSMENEKKVKEILRRYPEERQASAILPLLDLAQRQCGGWLPKSAIEAVTEMLAIPLMRGYEVATFYSLFNLNPIGKYHVQICGTTPCMLRGSEDLKKACENHLRIRCGETTKDGIFTLSEVECIGACVNAPAVQINDDYYEDLNEESFLNIIVDIEEGRETKQGSAIGRQGSAPLKRDEHVKK
ncbi:MAG: NADH-quinone oxidoreductase subunit NuoE [Alphaproteobacteria bacterium]|nr:NADH-quinone oxidoreductase subunit NuoE [Alphaproteobacteria bacterium]